MSDAVPSTAHQKLTVRSVVADTKKKSEDVTEKITSPPDFHISTMEAWLLKSLVKTAITTKGHFFPILVRTQATLLPYSFFCATELDIFQFSIDIIPYTSIVVVYNQPG